MTTSAVARLTLAAVLVTVLRIDCALAQNKVVIIPLADETSAAASAVASDGNSTDLGLLVSVTDDQSQVDLLDEKGYLLRVSLRDGEAESTSLWYSDATCSGVPHTDKPNGSVFKSGSLLYYVDRASTPVASFPIQSALFEGVCSDIGGGTIPFVWPASPNDPNVTGVSSSDLPVDLPIRFERR